MLHSNNKRTQGHVTRGHVTRGHVMRGHVTRGHETRGHVTRGHETRGHVTRGHETCGHVTRGHVTRGHVTRGHVTRGHVTRGHLCGRSRCVPAAGPAVRTCPQSVQLSAARPDPESGPACRSVWSPRCPGPSPTGSPASPGPAPPPHSSVPPADLLPAGEARRSSAGPKDGGGVVTVVTWSLWVCGVFLPLVDSPVSVKPHEPSSDRPSPSDSARPPWSRSHRGCTCSITLY